MSGSTFDPNKYKNKSKKTVNKDTSPTNVNTSKVKYKGRKLLNRKSLIDFDTEDKHWRNSKTTY